MLDIDEDESLEWTSLGSGYEEECDPVSLTLNVSL